MRSFRLWCAVGAAVAAMSVLAPAASAQEFPAQSIDQIKFLEANTILPEVLTFDDGFLALSREVAMGDPIEPMAVQDDGSIVQVTSLGLAYWLPDVNQPSFTNGWDRWALTDYGFITWQGESLVAPEPAPAPAPVPVYLSPRDYLWAVAPSNIVSRLDCIASHESGFNPSAKNGHSTASGVFQFLNTTWAFTPQGRAGYSVFDAHANIDAGIWLYQTYGPTQWEVFTKGLCR